jgi:hypothetical protein
VKTGRPGGLKLVIAWYELHQTTANAQFELSSNLRDVLSSKPKTRNEISTRFKTCEVPMETTYPSE